MMSPIKWILGNLLVVSFLTAQAVSWSKNVISTTLTGAKKNAVVNLDADASGYMDIVVTANPEGSGAEDPAAVNVLWFKNDGTQTFTVYNIDFYNVGARGLAVGDLTGNGYPDIVVGNGATDSSLVWYKNDGTPTTGPWAKVHLGSPAPYNYITLLYDIDGDGDLDIVDGMGDDADFGTVGGGTITDSLRWFENLGGVDTAVFSPRLIAQYSSPSGITIGDYNADGRVDISAGAFVDNSTFIPLTEEDIRWWSQGTGGTWTQEQVIQQSYGTNGLATKDLDQNGTLDIIGAGYKLGTIDWWSNNGTGVFSSINTIKTSFLNTRNVEVMDIDADGDWDIIAAADNNNTISWFENDGSQNFTERVVTNTFSYAYFVSASDLDGDGDVDLIGTAQNANELSWWANNLAEKQWIPASSTATYSYNGGKVDITFSSKDVSDSTSVLYNKGAVSDRASVDAAIDHVAANGFYTIVTAAGTYNATIDFTYAGISEWSAINNEADLRICVWNETTSQWEIAGTGSQTIDALNDVITVSGLNTELARFSLFTLGSVSTDNALPVELAAFTLTSATSGIELFWSTESERDNLGFEVWRKSAVEQDFVKISDYNNNGDLIGLGTSSYGQEYYLMDTDVQTGRRYSYQLRSRDYDGSLNVYPAKDIVYTGNTSVVTVSGLIPQTAELSQNFPNPFNGITRIDFAVPLSAAGEHVSLAIYDLRGRLIRRLIDTPLVEGRYFAVWDGRNQQGAEVASGMYVYLLQTGRERLSRRLTLLK
ncbi:MAG TPA: hypothetical protein ENJ15_00365 [Caldithrix abyssi]|uniref:FlgD/Vpr Ig-like domain-containing protein n=1 Tax=Caldithrix abyssi TaxID=187145 RepID=A0A7V5VE59_CALAY|nr:hypothetical protein [Caldithrix abyssi]